MAAYRHIGRTVLAFSAVLLVAAGCQKHLSGPGHNAPEPEERVPMLFGSSVGEVASQTRASGYIDDEWTGREDLYVYAMVIDKDLQLQPFQPWPQGRLFIDNVRADSPDPDAAEGEENLIYVYDEEPDDPPTRSGKELYYYQGDCRYDFFAYHVDDAFKLTGEEKKPVPVPSADGRRLELSLRIDGGPDILLAEADPFLDYEDRIRKLVEEGMTEEQAREWLELNNFYSAYTSRRDVTPNLRFSHMLTRFDFEIMTGPESQSASNVVVRNLTLSTIPGEDGMATGDRSRLVVVDIDHLPSMEKNPDELAQRRLIPEKVNAPQKFHLMYRSKGEDGRSLLRPLSDLYDDPEAVGQLMPEDQPKSIGAGLLLYPDETAFNLDLELVDPLVQSVRPVFRTFTLKAEDVKDSEDNGAGKTVFEAGDFYLISILIYGLEDIEISASLARWDDGGFVKIDPDYPDGKDDTNY